MSAAESSAEPNDELAVSPDLSPSTQALLGAIMAISTDLDLASVLTRLVEAAATLTGARYGALGVLGRNGDLAEFVTTGINANLAARIGELPHGHGMLRQLIEDPRPLRLVDLTTHPASIGMPVHHPQMRTFLGVPIRIRGTVFGNLYLTEKSESRAFTAQDEILVETLANAAAVVIENARAYGLSEQRRKWLEASAELTEALQPPITIEDALAEVTRRARAAAHACAAAVVQFPIGGHPVIAAQDGRTETDVAELVRQVVDQARIADQLSLALSVSLGARHAVVVPLRVHLGDASVLLVVHEGPTSTPEVEEREFLAAFADQAGLAIDRAEAVTGRGELAVVSERARIARDLHDVVIQRLFATGLRLEGLRTTPHDEDLDVVLSSVVGDLDQTIRDIRMTIFGLQQHDRTSFRGAVHDLLSEYTPVLGFAPALRTHGPLDLLVPENIAGHLLAVLREALSNVARHADAHDVVVEVVSSADEVILRVIDGGVGIPEHRSESGLQNARERAAILGGVLEVSPNVGPGTTLTWRAPVS